MEQDIDLHLGKKLRARRRLLGLTQQQLAQVVGVRFQQIQKYECGANRISASRLWELAQVLNVPIGYFYEGLLSSPRKMVAEIEVAADPANAESRDLIRAYYQLDEAPRRRLLDLARSLNDSINAA
jgi:transcriptional regulator with XRE-family HTH domain